jgi:predicted cupin superfamily sugar epimerase
MLTRGQRSHWHRVHDAAEVWHYYAGAPLSLHRSEDGTASETLTLGTNLPAGERPQAIIPANWWQSAETLGDFTLVGCTVSPGFEFSSFEMAPPDWKPGS